jgi:hypothetical protein
LQIKSNTTTAATNTIAALTEQGQNQLSPYMMFKYSIRSELTRKYYERRLRRFLDFIQFKIEIKDVEERSNNFAKKAKNDISWALNQIIQFLQFQKERVENEQITAATLKNFIKSLKIFCDSADLDLPWKKITRGLPKARQAANDRAPTLEELQKLVEYPDRRIKAIVCTMASSGIRIGAWDFLQWKHCKPIFNENKEVIAAKLIVYAGDIEEYYSFVTAEAYNALKDWIDFRISYGEKISDNSWLMRDLWQTSNIDYGAKWGLATNPKKLKSSGIKRLLERALWEQGIRQPLKEGAKRHEWKAAHGFRKFYKSHAEQVMRPINVEITMGHNIGLSASYYKPTEKEVLEDYLKAIGLLTLNDDNLTLQKQVVELTEKSKQENYIIKGKLADKENEIQILSQRDSMNTDAIASLSDKMQELMTKVQELEKVRK